MELMSIGILLVFTLTILVLIERKIDAEQKFNQKNKVLQLLIMELNAALVIQN